MGKIKTRIIGLEDIEEKQKKEQKERAAQKKAIKKRLKRLKHLLRRQSPFLLLNPQNPSKSPPSLKLRWAKQNPVGKATKRQKS